MYQQIPLWNTLVDAVQDQPRVGERPTRPAAPLIRLPQRTAPSRPSPGAPAWLTLTVILTAGVGLIAATDLLMSVGASRTIMGCLVVILMFSKAARWVRANRSALMRMDECECGRPSLEIRYVASERRPLWSAPANRRPRAPARAKGARQEPSSPIGR